VKRAVLPLNDVLWWISTHPAHRGPRTRLGQCLARLAAEGAREVIAHVDEDAPATRSTTPPPPPALRQHGVHRWTGSGPSPAAPERRTTDDAAASPRT
jgi:hypothetical protein